MVNPSPEPNARPSSRWWIGPLVIGLLHVALLRLLADWPAIYEIDADEGYNLIKALLLDQGYGFLTEIWSDQPPLYSYLLWAVCSVFGFEVWVARAVSLLFAVLLLGALYDTLRRSYGPLAGAGAVCLLVVSQRFARYSVAVMLGLPALALLALALWALVVWSQSRNRLALAGCGLFLGLSLSIKAFTAFAVPILLCGALLTLRRQGRLTRTALPRFAALLLAPLGAALVLGYLPALISGELGQLFGAHSRAAAQPHELGRGLLLFLWDDLFIFGVAGIGGVLVVVRRSLAGLVFGGWFVVALVLLAVHHPVWHHHVTLISIPAAALSGIALHHGCAQLTADGWSRGRVRAAGVLAITVAVSWILIARPFRVYELGELRRRGTDAADLRAHAVLERNLGPERTIVAARPMFAFRLGARVPPWIAVTSSKRFKAGLIDAEAIVDQIRSSRPEQVLISSRWKERVRARVRQAIAGHYRRVYDDRRNGKLEIFVRADRPAR